MCKNWGMWGMCKEMNTRWTGMHESKSKRLEKIYKEAKPEKGSQILAEMPRLINPRKVFRRYQGEKDCPGRIRGQRFCRQEEDEDDMNFQRLDLCVCISPRCGHILLCPCLHTTVCWDGPNSPSKLWPFCVCTFFAPQSRGHPNTFVFVAGRLHDGTHPPSSQVSVLQEPDNKMPFPCPSHPVAFLFWTHWTVFPLECTVNWLVEVPFSVPTPLLLHHLGTEHDYDYI